MGNPLGWRTSLTTDRRVLVVHASPSDGARIKFAVLDEGHRCELIRDCSVAASRAKEVAPHVVFIDIGFSEPEWRELTAQLRGVFGSTVRLVAVTRHVTPEAQSRAKSAGFDMLARVPLELLTLKRALAEVRRGSA